MYLQGELAALDCGCTGLVSNCTEHAWQMMGPPCLLHILAKHLQCSRVWLIRSTPHKLPRRCQLHSTEGLCQQTFAVIGYQATECTEPVDQLCCRCLSGSEGFAHLCAWGSQILVAALSAENLPRAILLPAGPLASGPVSAGLLSSDPFCLGPCKTHSIPPTLIFL